MTRFIIIFSLLIFIFSCDFSKKNENDKTYNKESELISELNDKSKYVLAVY